MLSSFLDLYLTAALSCLCTYIVLKASSCVTFSVIFLSLEQVLLISIQAPTI